MKKLPSTLPNMVLSLVGICLVVSGVLALLNDITQAPIAEAKVRAKVDAIKQVTPEFDNNPYQERFSVLLEGDKDSLMIYPASMGEICVGYAIETYTNNGFNGRISLMMGLDTAGVLVDFSVLELSETPGLGTKIPEWFHTASNKGHIQDMRGLNMPEKAPLKVTKDGGEVDAITAATISSRAFLDAVNRGYNAYLQIKGQATDGVSGATAQADDTDQTTNEQVTE
ncbi:MAG: RnfABCDGE type electron transport complex subunit G [Porphyromonadaceae bacterium]|nr:RnfABCDGE type electron transport complex subunit G [Porphyromonadaceae bacterium]